MASETHPHNGKSDTCFASCDTDTAYGIWNNLDHWSGVSREVEVMELEQE